MKVWLVMLVERDTEGRMGGEIFEPGRGTLAGFSGTPQMLKIMEELVPPHRPVQRDLEPVGPVWSLCSAAGPAAE